MVEGGQAGELWQVSRANQSATMWLITAARAGTCCNEKIKNRCESGSPPKSLSGRR